MQKLELKKNLDITILALGAESAGNFSICTPIPKPSSLAEGRIKKGSEKSILYFSEDFGDLLAPKNFLRYQKELFQFLKKNDLKPDIILSDLHPEFVTTTLAKKLAKKYQARHIQVQHHHAHIFSAIADHIITVPCFGIACDGTGYAEDGTVWGGEIFKISKYKCQISNKIQDQKLQIERVAHLENQTLIGGEKAIQEPARLIISILFKHYSNQGVIPDLIRNPEQNKKLDSRFRGNDKIYRYVRKYYSKNEFELLWNQLEQNFNCIQTSSTARVLDAVSVLLGFSKNERLSKHGPVSLLEKNSTKPYRNINSKIQITNSKQITKNKTANNQTKYILDTTYLFEYLIKNLHKDKGRLAATAQQYIADGLINILKKIQNEKTLKAKSYKLKASYFAGGMANNKIISETLKKQGFYISRQIPPGDAGISVGQIFYHIYSTNKKGGHP